MRKLKTASHLRLAVDGMGGDKAPESIVEGIALALKVWPEVIFQLYGNEGILRGLIRCYPGMDKQVFIYPTLEVIAADTPPSLAVRGFKNSSMRRALEAVALGEAHGVISAGNTGAYLALCRLVLGVVKSISRPAIAGFIPTHQGKKTLMLDLGANPVCTSENLIDFARMGKVFAQLIMEIPQPRIGLLNIGSEEGKGSPLIRDAAMIFRNQIDGFQGFIEGDQVTQGHVDVIISDGFSGNVALKTGEGIMRFITESLHSEVQRTWVNKLRFLFVRSIFSSLRHKFDPRLSNGALWLGLRHVAVKSHGSADGLAFFHALNLTLQMMQSQIIQRITDALTSASSAQAKPLSSHP